MMKNITNKNRLLIFLLSVCLVLCACNASTQTVSNDVSRAASQAENESVESHESIPTESEAYEQYLEMVHTLLDASRPPEAYQFPDPSGEITDVRVTIREREIDLSFRGLEGHKAYDIFYGYCSDGKWYDYPSTNYELRELVDTDVWGPYTDDEYSSYDICNAPHIVEIGPYYLMSFPQFPSFNSMKLYDISIQGSLNSEAIVIDEYYIPPKDSYDLTKNVLLFENMRAYGTEDYDFALTDFLPLCFIIIAKEAMTEEYSLTFETHWANPPQKDITTYTYDEIMGALNR